MPFAANCWSRKLVAAGGEQLERAIRNFAGPRHRAAERNHGSIGRAHCYERAGVEFTYNPTRDQRHPAEQRAAVGDTTFGSSSGSQIHEVAALIRKTDVLARLQCMRRH